MTKITKSMLTVMSGGQTGVDRGALEGARDMGVKTKGYASYNFMTENGSDPTLKEFGLIDSGRNYKGRTELNAQWSDGTIWIGKQDSAGYIATRNACNKFNRKFIHHTSVNDTITIIHKFGWSTINFAGSRESRNIGIQETARKIVRGVLTNFDSVQGTLL
jgi:hypothetical protein